MSEFLLCMNKALGLVPGKILYGISITIFVCKAVIFIITLNLWGSKKTLTSIVERYLAQVVTVMVFLLLSSMEQLAVMGRTLEAHCLDTTSFPVLLLIHWIALDL